MDGPPTNFLKAIRKQKGLRANALAERLEVSPAQISRWENGKDDIPGKRLPSLADAYGTSIGAIYAGADHMAGEIAPSPAPGPREETLISLLVAAAPALQEGQSNEVALREVARSFAAALRMIAEDPSIQDVPDRLDMAARAIADAARYYTNPPSPNASRK